MKTIQKAITLITIALISSCSPSDNDNDNDIEEKQITPEQATIDSYSKNYGYSGDDIIIGGTNFTTEINEVKVFFDDTEAEVNSVNNTEISVKLPMVSNTIPVLKVEIKNRIISNNVQNDYGNNIGILASTLNEWHGMDHNLPFGLVFKSQSIGKESFYFSTGDSGGSGVYRTKDGGLTWTNWGRTGFDGSFFATSNDEGWTQTTFGVNKVPIGGSTSINSDVHSSTSTIGLYVNDALTNGFLISKNKVVFETTNGESFTEVYNNDPTGIDDPRGASSNVRVFSELDENHIWAGGYIEVDQNLGYTPINKFYAPLVLFLDNGVWTETSISGLESSTAVKQIQFINEDKGYLSTRRRGRGNFEVNRLYKSIDGGNSWELLHDANSLSIRFFAFKNETIGWFCSENKIYKTTDGGVNWILDYTHDSDIVNVTYGDGVVWAVTSDKILKYFTE